MSPWRVVCDEERFNELREDDRFVALLTLGRATNAIRFYHHAYLDAAEDDSPAGKRQRLNAFMFLGAALREALRYSQTLGRHFADSPGFECFRKLLGSNETQAYQNGILRHLRNKVTAHFEEQITRETLSSLDFGDPRLACGEGKTVGASYYDLADEVAVHSVLVVDAEEPRSWDELEELMKQTRDISIEFGKCADRLIGEVGRRMGWQLERG